MPEGTIIKALSGFYYVKNGHKQIQCRARGLFRKQGISPLVGDHVVYEAENGNDGYILSVKARKNALKRPPIANVDLAVLVFSVAEPACDCVLLDRFLIAMETQNIKSLICFTKWDLLSESEQVSFRSRFAVYEQIGYHLIFTSCKQGEGLEKLKSSIQEKISVVTGQSGVGKSTLLNHLDTSLNIETQAISHALGRGKHTTRHVELLPVSLHGFVADTPGFSALTLPELTDSQLADCFPEFDQYREGCRFRGCMHLAEPDCMVKQAVAQGKISQSRYEHYRLFFHELSERERNKY
ncbi:ribosome small subunit-dependent GTPase A [Sporolactobacillus sp. CPB3-1]|uniref:Small ribosomal subunit biogenesis GTPase RsgA n=1 Tax=Sporolactobacillus mangiferae TaxID=2940498 RepID=A0ABT0M7R2_9BACL|nr:ribosome small subunit-dependent GTPase A [Sporolactobacillus mangiferae]MCL1630905.1 ribosome small subunit-dependent GTPase A [Sporolactobacillus mangiferae]